ncbi:MAG TPA: Ig-like domain-containing protein [Ramlibacter sp.]|uniref:Ig-like domain-containing protein n=1 Tax=Ramlibacter sp. TaxID=1917967 RepID=UPI002D12F495|nr:Ig-like domain-containing protein [Ramlibacter sp.]HVZ43898.1 Ig-like domain-containing protein [Ramlibacter sp.]
MANSAPVFVGGAYPALTSIAEDASNPTGTVVSTLVGRFTDADSDPIGIAVTAVDASIGTWEYSLDAGISWRTIDAGLLDSTTNELALLLGPDAMVRLLPFADLNGDLSAAISFRAWDGTSGSEGDYTVITANGGTTAFGDTPDVASLSVTAVNDAPSFAVPNGTGKELVSVLNGFDDGAASLLVQPDGKLLLAGSSKNGGVDQDFSVVRLNADGSLDTSFNPGGTLPGTKAISAGSTEDTGTTVALQPDGKILVGGYYWNGVDYDFAVMRLYADGSFDPSFDSNGVKLMSVGSDDDFASSITVQPDGKILVGGYSSNGANHDFSLVRLNANGSLDTSFNSAGSTPGTELVPVGGGNDRAFSVTLQADGKILLAGHSANGASFEDFSLVRLNADGTLDASFNSGGPTPGTELLAVGSFDDNAYSVTLQADGKILLAGTSSNGSTTDFSIVRLNADGSLDTSFNAGDPTPGTKVLPIGSSDDVALSVAVQPDGKILLGGHVTIGGHEDFCVVRLDADGSLDTTFNPTGATPGVETLAVGSGDDEAVSLAVQPDGRIVLAGRSWNGTDWDTSVVRLDADGSLDSTFNATPSSSTLGGTVTYVKGHAPVALDSSVAVYDPDLAQTGNYAGASVTLERDGGAASEDVFSALGNLSFSGADVLLSGNDIGDVTNAGGTLTITFDGNATQAAVDEALSSIGYSNSSSTPPATVQVDWTFSDGNTGAAQGSGGELMATGSVTVDITPTTVTNVTSSSANSTYGTGNTISIQVAFSDAVTVIGTPQLKLETGTTDEVINYKSGSGTNTLTFDYVVKAGDKAADLDYANTTALTLNGGSIKDTAGNDATLTLATPGNPGSLGANKDIVVDTQGPTVAFVTAGEFNGTYAAGDTIHVQVWFSEPVSVTGTPTLTLETGTTDEVVTFTGSSGNSLDFDYVVKAGDKSLDLDYTGTTALALNGGTIKDGAGNAAVLTLATPGTSGSLGFNKNIVIDTIAPPVTAPDLYALSDSGRSLTDNITNQTTLTFIGSAEALSTVTLYDADKTTVLGTTSAAADGSWTIDNIALTPGTHTVWTTATDSVNNVSTPASLTLTIDTTAPGAPAALDIAASFDTGRSNTDNITQKTTPTVTGTAEPNSTVTLYDTGGTLLLGTVQASAGGAWSIAIPTYKALGDGVHTLTVTATDVAGNVSAASTLAVEVDRAPPSAPTALDLGAIYDSGSSNTDNVTNFKTLAITGKSEANATVTLYDNGSSVLGTALADGSGDWSVTTSTLGDGKHTLTAKATDAAGNVSTASAALAVTVDTSGPGAPSMPDLTAASDTGASSSDNITSSGTATFTGTVAAGSEVTLYDGATPLGTVTAAGSAWTFTGVSLTEGTHTMTAKAADAAGNMSGASFALQVTIDQTAPLAPSTPALTKASDTGTLGDGVTSVKAPTFTGTAEAGATVTLKDGATVLGTTTAAGGTWTLTSPALAEGTHTITATATDAAGNVGPASSAVISIDAIATVLDVTSSNPNHAYKAGDVISIQVKFSEAVTVASGTPTLKLETGTTDELATYASGAGTDTLTFNYTVQPGDKSADLNYWSTTALTGSITDNDTVHDAANLTLAALTAAHSLGTNKAIVIDTAAPATLLAPDMTALTDTGSSTTDNITGVATPVFTGKAEAGSTVTLYDGATVVGSFAVPATGAWSITSSSLAVGTHSITATATDAAGNVSAASPALAVTIATVGGTGNDNMSGTGGNDILDGGKGADTMAGGLGDDTYIVDSTLDVVQEPASGGTDTVEALVSCTLAAEVENLVLLGTAALNATGNALDNLLTGNSAANRITGGAGADTMTGAGGSDTFAWSSASESQPTGYDVITDFTPAQRDLLDLRSIDPNAGLAGDQKFTFIGTASFSATNATAQLRFDPATHMLLGSTDADAAAEFAVQLTGVTTLSASSLLL